MTLHTEGTLCFSWETYGLSIIECKAMMRWFVKTSCVIVWLMVSVLLTKTAIMPEYVRIGSFENREGVEKARQRHDEEEKVGWGRDLVKKLRRLGSTEGLPHSQSQHAMTAGIWHKSMCVNTEGVGHYDLGCVIACGVDTLYYRTRVRRVGVFDFGTGRVGYLPKSSGTGTGRDG